MCKKCSNCAKMCKNTKKYYKKSKNLQKLHEKQKLKLAQLLKISTLLRPSFSISAPCTLQLNLCPPARVQPLTDGDNYVSPLCSSGFISQHWEHFKKIITKNLAMFYCKNLNFSCLSCKLIEAKNAFTCNLDTASCINE